MIGFHSIVFVIGALVVFLGAANVVPLCVSLILGDPDASAFTSTMLIAFAAGGLCIWLGRHKDREITNRGGFVIVGLGWITAALLGALPYWLSGALPSFTDAFFESASGFTTTGATVFKTVEDLSRGILLWRSMTQWFGGMGIIVMSLAVLPLLGVGGMQLFRAEAPGPVTDKLKPRISETAKVLWKVYVLITAAEVLLLMLCGMGPFDAICHAFTTLATGGFSTRNAGVMAYGSPAIEIVITVFMVIAGINFALHFRALTGRPLVYVQNSECKFYLGVFLFATIFIAAQIAFEGIGNIGESIRLAAFQVGSIFTTTGYASADYETWPVFSQIGLFFLMFVGGCSGSTGGGMKCMRVMIVCKYGYRELRRLIHPRAVLPVKLSGQAVPQDVVSSIVAFFVLFSGIFIVSSLAMALLGLDFVSAFSSVIACLGNVGPGLGTVGPTDNFSHIHAIGKWILSMCMIVGRLEVYTVILLFVPEFWRK